MAFYIEDNTTLSGNIFISGNITISGNTTIIGDAYIGYLSNIAESIEFQYDITAGATFILDMIGGYNYTITNASIQSDVGSGVGSFYINSGKIIGMSGVTFNGGILQYTASSGNTMNINDQLKFTIESLFGSPLLLRIKLNLLRTFVTVPTPFTPYNIQLLVVGGGGAAAAYGGNVYGGAGGGQVYYNSGYTISSNFPIYASVGDGGVGVISIPPNGRVGGPSLFGTILSIGGQGNVSMNGGNSGGGKTGGIAINVCGAGGAGASQNGFDNNSTTTGSNGGSGLTYSISGVTVTYGGGGGGAGNYTGGNGGTGGGHGDPSGTNGTPNTGGGAGGTKSTSVPHDGGSGIIILRYTSSTKRGNGGTVYQIGGDWVHVFTSSGYFYPTN